MNQKITVILIYKLKIAMINFIISTGITLVIAIIISLLKVFAPEESYKMRTSLVLGTLAIILFAIYFLILLSFQKWSAIWPIIYCLLYCLYIYEGSKSVALKTATGVVSKVTNEFVGYIGAGLHWADPIFEIVTISVDGVPNKSADLQKLTVEISETPLMQTATRGIQVRIKRINFMLELIASNIQELFNIEGGSETIRERIVEYIDEFFLEKISKLAPEKIDQNKAETIKKLAEELEEEVNEFCKKNNYPYQISSKVIIGDTELEAKYYEVLAKKEFMKLEQEALDVESEMIRKRLLDLGNNLLPTASENEKLKAAMVALKITPKTIEEKTFGVSPEISILAKELVDVFKK